MRRGFGVAAVYGALTVALLFPLLGRFGSAFPHDPGDPLLNTWILWHSARTVPLTAAWWNGPMFFPMADSIALSEGLLSLLPMSWVVQTVTHNPVAAYNVVFALSFPLCGLGAFLLARELTGRDDAALIGGLAFMLAPYRAEQLSHLQVLSYYWAPMVLFALHRYWRDRHWKWIALFACAWLAQSLVNGYAMFHVSVLLALWIVWFMRPLRTSVPVLVAWAAGALGMLPILLKYQQVHTALHLLRDINEIKRFGVDLGDFLAAPPDLALWGGRLGTARPETAAFAGITLLVLAVAAIVVTRREPREREPQKAWQRVFVAISAVAALVAFSAYFGGPWRIGPLSVSDFHKPFSIAVAARLLAFLGSPWMRRMWNQQSVAGFYLVATAVMLLLALGPEPRLLGRPILYQPPYSWLMHLPGFSVLRVPARFVMPAALCESVLVALAIARWAVPSRRFAVVALVSLGIVLDGWFQLPVAAAPAGGIHAWPEPTAAVVELPLGEQVADFAALYRSMVHGLPVLNGVSGYVPPHFLPLAQALRDRQFSVLYELSGRGPIGVAFNRTSPDAAETLRLLRVTGFTPGPSEGDWDSVIVPVRRHDPIALGARMPIASVQTSKHQEYVGRMLDDDLLTGWGTEVGQAGGEEVIVDLGSNREVGAIVLEMGAYSFGYPRALEIDVSTDRAEWAPVWGGEPAVLTVRGALQDPGTTPIVLDLGRVSGRYVRLTQTGADPGIPWWIANLRLHAPVQPANH